MAVRVTALTLSATFRLMPATPGGLAVCCQAVREKVRIRPEPCPAVSGHVRAAAALTGWREY